MFKGDPQTQTLVDLNTYKMFNFPFASFLWLLCSATNYWVGMEVSTEKSKIMINSRNNISAGISMNGQRLEEVISFNYL